MFATTAARQSGVPAFSALHRRYVMDLYRRMLRNSLDWNIRRDTWRQEARNIRADFELNRNVRNPRELANLLNKAEEKLASQKHPDPYKPPTYVGGTKCVTFPYVQLFLPCILTKQPRLFTDEEKNESLKDQNV